MNKTRIIFRDNIKRLGVMGLIPFLIWPIFFLVVTYIVYRTEYKISLENVQDETIIRAYNVSEGFKDYLNEVTLIVDTASETIEDMLNQGYTTDDVQAYLVRKSQHLASIISGDTKGIYGYVQGTYVDGDKWVPDESYVPTERVWYKKALEAQGQKIIVDPYVDARTGKLVVTASKLLSDNESVLSIDIWLSRMQQMTEDVSEADENHTVMILDNSGNVVAHSNPREVGLNYKDSEDPGRKAIFDAWHKSHGKVVKLTYEDSEYLLYPKNISDSWTVITMTNAEPAMEAITKLTRAVMASAIAGLIITFAVITAISAQKIKVMKYAENIQSIANIYTTMHKLDLETYDSEMITCQDLTLSKLIGSERTHCDESIKRVMGKVSDERSLDEVLEFVNLTTLDERMAETDSISMEFLNWDHKWDRARFVVAERKPDKSLKSVIFAIEPIDKEKRSRDKLQYLAETDQLTRLNNRGSGENKIRNLLRTGEGGMFVLFDVDRFKSINDNFGHNAGDKVLVAIGEAMRKTFREKDIILRLGGDEFAAFTPSIRNVEAGQHVIDRLIAAVDDIDLPEISGQKVCISIGAAFYMPEDIYSFEELYKHADSCTYISKKTRGSVATFYEDGKEE